MNAITSGEGLIATVWTASCVTGSGCFMFDRESVKIRKARESRVSIVKSRSIGLAVATTRENWAVTMQEFELRAESKTQTAVTSVMTK